MKVIRYYSEINPWVDGIVICQDEDYPLAKIAISAGIRGWINGYGFLSTMGHGDAIDWALKFLGIIDYQLICHNSENTTKEYESFWKDIIDQFSNITSVGDGFWSEALKVIKNGPLAQ